MIKNTPIETTLNRAFAGLEIMLGCPTTKTHIKPKKKKKKCCGGGSKCKSSGFVPDKTKEK
jgi:hypothetical protein